MFDKLFWREIGSGCEHPIPNWVKTAEHKGRSRFATYHGIPYETKAEFKGRTFMYKVVYGSLDGGQGISANMKFYRKQRRKQYKNTQPQQSDRELFSRLFG